MLTIKAGSVLLSGSASVRTVKSSDGSAIGAWSGTADTGVVVTMAELGYRGYIGGNFLDIDNRERV